MSTEAAAAPSERTQSAIDTETPDADELLISLAAEAAEEETAELTE